MVSKKHYDIYITLFYFFCIGAQSIITSYLNVYLEKHLGFSGSQLGLYTSITPLLPAIVLPLIGIVCDRTKRYKETLLCFIGLMIGSSALLSLQTSLFMVLAVGIILEISKSTTTSLSDTQVTEYCSKNNKNYGMLRTSGSVGWVTFGVLVGFLTDYIPLESLLFPSYIGLGILSLLFAATFPNTRKEASEEEASTTSPNENPLSLLIHNKSFMTMLFVIIVACMAGETSLAYLGNHLVTTMGGSESLIGLNTVFCVVPEFFLFPAINSIIKKYGYKNVYLLATIGATLRFTIYFLAENPYIFLLGSLFHCLGSACITAVNLSYAYKVVDSSVFVTAMAVTNTVATISKAVYGYFFGYIYETFGSRYIFLSVLPLCIFMVLYVLRSSALDIEKQAVKS